MRRRPRPGRPCPGGPCRRKPPGGPATCACRPVPELRSHSRVPGEPPWLARGQWPHLGLQPPRAPVRGAPHPTPQRSAELARPLGSCGQEPRLAFRREHPSRPHCLHFGRAGMTPDVTTLAIVDTRLAARIRCTELLGIAVSRMLAQRGTPLLACRSMAPPVRRRGGPFARSGIAPSMRGTGGARRNAAARRLGCRASGQFRAVGSARVNGAMRASNASPASVTIW